VRANRQPISMEGATSGTSSGTAKPVSLAGSPSPISIAGWPKPQAHHSRSDAAISAPVTAPSWTDPSNRRIAPDDH
jgi:hypothetical protein